MGLLALSAEVLRAAEAVLLPSWLCRKYILPDSQRTRAA